MPDLLRKSAAWLGLVTDDRYTYDNEDQQGDEVDEETQAVDPEQEQTGTVTSLEPRRRPQPPRQQHQEEPSVADMSRIVTVHPRTYNEARTIGEHYRDGVPVIMNLSDMEDADAKRLVDFAAGLVFGLRGTIERVTSKVFLLSPHNVSVAAEDKQRIAAGGFFNQS